MMNEVVPMAPSVHHEWVGGHWNWNGVRWVWMPGHFITRRHGMMWQRPAWVRHGAGWHLIPGHWRRM